MDSDIHRFNIEELSEQSGVSVRTIRFYISEGLVSRPEARGKGASYGEEHLSRLLLIRRLSEQRVPLSEIRDRLAGLSLSDVRELLRAEERHGAELEVAEEASAKEYISALLSRARRARSPSMSQPNAALAASIMGPGHIEESVEENRAQPKEADLSWRRIELAPGIELHVRADAEVRYRRLIKRLLEQSTRGSPS